MSLILSGTNGLSDVDGTAATPAIRGTDTNTGIFFPAADTVAASVGGTEGVRLTSTGLGIGTTSPTARLDVSQANAKSATGIWQIQTFDSTSQTTGVGGGISFSGYKTAQSAAEVFAGIDGYKENSTAGNAAGALRFHTQVSGGSGLVERARITSGGYLLVGTTSVGGGGANIFSINSSALNPLQVDNSHTSSPYGAYFTFSGASPNNSTNYFLYCADTTTVRVVLRSNGGIANYQANDVNLSDRREKTNFAPAKSYLDTICAIPVQTFSYIDQSEDDPGLTLGVVAQDVQAVAPELVSESNWGTKDDPKMRLSIYQTDLQYALMKCIQEQQAIITALTARITALEAK
jgi:hypothetical protein